MIRRLQVLYTSSWWFAAQHPLLKQAVQPTLASFHHKTNNGPSPRPSHLANHGNTPIRVNPLAFSVCGICSAEQQTSLNTFTDGTQKRMGYTPCKDDLMAYSLCILIVFEGDIPNFFFTNTSNWVFLKDFLKSNL
jgi:hypothetical protein